MHGRFSELIIRPLFNVGRKSEPIITKKEAEERRRRWNAPSPLKGSGGGSFIITIYYYLSIFFSLDETLKTKVGDPSWPQHQQVDIVALMTTTQQQENQQLRVEMAVISGAIDPWPLVRFTG